MDGGKPDASDIVAEAGVKDLAAIFKTYGEEKKAGQIARAIVAAREIAPVTTTTQLAAIIEKAAPVYGKSRIHPATRVFQALRIFVNDELGQLTAGLRAAEKLLRPAGRLVVVTFHSLEDRIVKRFFSSRSAEQPKGSRHAPPSEKPIASFALISAKVLIPDDDEVARNPRARSAKLRAGARLDGPPAPENDDALGAPRPISMSTPEKGKNK